MTANRLTTIWCDGKADIDFGHGVATMDCGRHVQGDSATDARRVARSQGWLVRLPEGRDLCRHHHHQRHATTRWGDGTR